MKTKPASRLSSPLAAAIAAMLSGPSAQAQTTWDGGSGVDNNWGTAANWVGDVAPTPGAAADLIFAGTTRLAPVFNYANGDDFHDITFAAGAGAFTIANTGTNGIDWFGSIINNSSNTQTIGFRLYQSASNGIQANTGDITLNSSALLFRNSQSLTLTAAGGRLITLQSVIADGGGAGGSILLNGAGTVRFAANNTFTSGIAVDSGTAIASVNNAALGTATAFVGNGGVSSANTNASLLIDQSGLTIANTITTNKADTGMGLGTGTRTIGGSFTSGSSTFSGTISLNGGAVLTAGSGGTVIFDGVIQNGVDTGNVSRNVTINAAGGTIQFNKINTYSGTTTINSGIVDVRAGTAGGSAVWGSGPITLNQGATLFLNPVTQAVQNTAGFSVTGAITLSGGAGTSTLRFSGNDNKFVLSGGITGQAGVVQTLAISQGVFNGNGDRMTTQFTGAIADGAGGTLGVSVNFAGATTAAQRSYANFSGPNTFTGDLTITNTQGLNGSGTHPGAWLTIGGLRHDGFGATPTLVSVGTGFLGAGADYSGAISISNGTGGLTTLGFLTSANQILRGVISGTGSLHQGGTGTLTLTNANTFSGTTTVAGGKIILGNTLALQNSPYVTTGSNGSTIGIDLTGYTTPTLGGLGGAVNLASAFTAGFTGSVSNLTLNPQAGTAVTYSGNIANGSMILTKTGAGTQVLSGTNTYVGGTNLSVGMLQFGKLVSQPATGAVAVTGGTLAVNLGGTGEWTTGTSGNGTIGGLLAGLGGQSGGTVNYSGNVALGFDTTNGFANPNGIATQTYSGAIANVGTTLGITKLGTNFLILAGNNTYTGATTVNAGRLFLTGTNSYTGGSFINGGMLQFGKLTAQPVSGAVAVGTGGTLAVNLGGTGEWTTGTSGNGTIGGLLAGLGGQSGGTVNYTGNVALGFDTSNATSTQTYSNAIGNVGGTLGITKLGTGTLTLSGVNTYTGATTVNGGTLLLDKTGTGGTAALASTSALVLGGGNFQMLGKTTGTTTQTLGALTLTANTNNTITLNSNGGTGTTLTLANSGPTRGVGSSLLIDRTIANTTLTTTFGLTAAAQTTTQGILGYALVKDATGIGFAANVGGSIVRYTGADPTTSASSNSSATNFKITPTGTTTTGSPLFTTANNAAYNSLQIDTASATGANFLSLQGTVQLTQRALLMTGNNNFTIQGGTRLGDNNQEVIVHQTGSGTLTISSLISSGTGSLTKDGTGTLIVTNASNAYNGSTTLNAGTLQYASKTAFGTSTLYLAGGTKLQKITEEANSVGNAMSNNIILTGGQVETNVDFSTAKDQWYTGVISGAGSLRVTGSGLFSRQFALSGNNTFVGGVTLDTATASSAWILLGNAAGLGTGTLTINHTGGNANQGLGANTNLTSGSGVANNIVINSSATLNLGGPGATGNVLLSGIVSGAGSLNKSDVAATTFTLGGTAANTYGGTTTVSSGVLALNKTAGVNAIAGAITLGDGAGSDILRLDASNQIADAAVITFNAATGANAGIFRLNNQSETVAGIASTGGGGIIENESGSAATGTLTVNNSAAQFFSGIIRNGDGSGTDGTLALTKTGNGTLTLTNSNTYTGATNVNEGKLLINGNQSAAPGAVSIAALATLGGNGTVGGASTFTGASIHAPGSAAATVGTQTFSSTVTYGTGTIFDWDLNTLAGGDVTDPGVVADALTGTYDKVTATGAITATGSAAVFRIVLAAGDSFADAFWDTDKSWTNIFTGGVGSASHLAAMFSGFDASGGLDASGLVAGRGQFTLSNVSNTLSWAAIPEPTSALAGLLLTAGLLRRRRK